MDLDDRRMDVGLHVGARGDDGDDDDGDDADEDDGDDDDDGDGGDDDDDGDDNRCRPAGGQPGGGRATAVRPDGGGR